MTHNHNPHTSEYQKFVDQRANTELSTVFSNAYDFTLDNLITEHKQLCKLRSRIHRIVQKWPECTPSDEYIAEYRHFVLYAHHLDQAITYLRKIGRENSIQLGERGRTDY